MSKEATIIQNFNAEKRKYEYSIKGYDVTKSIEILLKKHKEEYDKERRVFESTKGYLEAQQEYEKHIANLQSQLDQQKAVWNELKEFVNKKDLEYYSTLNNIGFNDKSSKFLFAKYNFCGEIKNKIKELEKGSADGNIK